MNRPVGITKKNVYAFLRSFAKDIDTDDLEMLPHRGINIVFYYRDDRILKVAKSENARLSLLKEAAILQYLADIDLPVVLPKPLFVHDEGHYFVQSRIDGSEVSPNALGELSDEGRQTFARSMGEFLTFLHTHEFPETVLSHIPQSSETLELLCRRAERKISFIEENSRTFDTSEWKERLNGVRGSLDENYSVTHGDLNLDHVFSVRGEPGRFAVIDFNCALILDPAVDLSELLQDLPSPVSQSESMQEMMLKHYSTGDAELKQKVSFRFLCDQIHGAYRKVKKSLK